MQPCKVSILVPVYNVKKYLRECLSSLEWQTLEDIQIICIDDGSTDSSPDILAEYAARDSRFEIITKENSGYGDSMNRGLAQARGEYVGIVESDDFANADMFEKLYDIAHENEVDIVKSNFFEHTNQGGQRCDTLVDNLAWCRCDKVFCPLDEQNIFLTQPAIWSALYKRTFLEENGIKFLPTPGSSFQDTSFNFKVFAAAKRVILTHDAYLHYRTDNDSSSVKSQSKVFPICDEYDEIWRFTKERPELWDKLSHTIPHIEYGGYIWNLRRLSPEIQLGFYRKFVETFQDLYDQGLIDFSRFDPPVARDIIDMLNDPDRFFKNTFGPLQVDTTYLISVAEGCAEQMSALASSIGGHTDENTEIICIAPDGDGEALTTIDALREADKRFFSKDTLFANPAIERIDPARIRGAHLITCALSALSDQTDDNNKSERTRDIEAKQLRQTDMLELASLIKNRTDTISSVHFGTNGVGSVAFYDTASLCALDLPILVCLLTTSFYIRELGNIISGASSTSSAIPSINTNVWNCPLVHYENACTSLESLIDHNKRIAKAQGMSYEEQKHAWFQIAGIWNHVRALYRNLSYENRARAGQAPHTKNDSVLIFGQNDDAHEQPSADVSIIIPVYNVDKSLLQECMDSVLSQKNCTFEVLCINDGSCDDSIETLEHIAADDERIRVITQFNEGVSVARNRGIDFATGDFYTFIDPDDYYVTDDALCSLIDAARENDALLCGGSFSTIDDNTGEIQEVFHGDESPYAFKRDGWRTFAEDQFDYGWIRFIYHHSIFDDPTVRFPLITHYEDPVLFARIASGLEHYWGITKTVYRYRIHYKETTWRAERVIDMLKGIQTNLELARAHDLDRFYTLLIRRIEIDYYQPIMDNFYDRGVIEQLANIQAKLEPRRISWVREADECSYVIAPLRNIPIPITTSNPPGVAIVRLAEKLGHSSPYRFSQRVVWKAKDLWR